MFSKADVLVSNFHSHRLKKNPFLAEMLNGACAALLPHGWDLTPTSGSRLKHQGTEVEGERGEQPSLVPFPEHAVSDVVMAFKQHYTHLSSKIKCY